MSTVLDVLYEIRRNDEYVAIDISFQLRTFIFDIEGKFGMHETNCRMPHFSIQKHFDQLLFGHFQNAWDGCVIYIQQTVE